MRTSKIAGFGLAGLVLIASEAFGQAPGSPNAGARFAITSARQGAGSEVDQGEMIREIVDPRNGDRWILSRSLSHPAGPGRLVLLASLHLSTRQAELAEEAPAPVIHSGERVIVEQHSAKVDSRLEGVAMGSALAGSLLNVRLSVGGRVLRTQVVGPGRAVIHEETRP